MTRPLAISATLLAAVVAAVVALTWPAPSAPAAGPGADITGIVKLAGPAPARPVLNRSSEPICNTSVAYDEAVCAVDGALKNVHVSIESGTMGKHAPPKKPVIVQQHDCIYVPRVQGIQSGQKLLISNGDRTMHNVHARADGRTRTNRGQPEGAKPIELVVTDAGKVFSLGCDVHRWMKAFLPVTDHPYFDVTGDDGTFTIKNVPKGKQVTVVAWHESFGKQTKAAVVGDTLEFVFGP